MDFRAMRNGENAMNDETAMLLLKNEKRASLAVNGDNGYPYVIPINFYYDEGSGRIYFHGSKKGHKADSIRNNDKVCFTVSGSDEKLEGEWAPMVCSIVVFGRCKLMETNASSAEILRKLAQRYYPDMDEMENTLQRNISNAQIFEINIEHITGKKTIEK